MIHVSRAPRGLELPFHRSSKPRFSGSRSHKTGSLELHEVSEVVKGEAPFCFLSSLGLGSGFEDL